MKTYKPLQPFAVVGALKLKELQQAKESQA